MSKTLKEDTYDRIIGCILQALADSFEFTKNYNEEDKAYYYKKLLKYLNLMKVKSIPKSDEPKEPEE